MKQEVQGSIPTLGKTFFAFVFMDTKEIEAIKNHRPICHGLFVRRRSIGPLPSCLSPNFKPANPQAQMVSVLQ